MLRSGFVEIDIPGHTWAQVVWTGLKHSQIVETADFHYDTAFTDEVSFLRPLNIQIGCGTSSQRVLIHFHHAQYDAWSWDNIVHDLQNLLSGNTLDPRPSFRNVTSYHLDKLNDDWI